MILHSTGLNLARPPGQVVIVVEGWRERGHNEGTSLREDAGYDEKC